VAEQGVAIQFVQREGVDMEDSYCTNCGQLMQADANFCSGCGKPKASRFTEGGSSSDEEVRVRVETDALKAEGITGQIEVSNGVIKITREGLRASLSQGKKGELSVPVNNVTRVDYKAPSLLSNGHIHFLLKGEGEDSHGILNCPLTVIFRKQTEEFGKIAQLVNRLKDETAVQKQGIVGSAPHEESPREQPGETRKDIQGVSSGCCPHCGAGLDPVPRVKKKCPSCKNDVYVKTDPRCHQTLLVKQEDALRLDALKKEAAASMRAVRNLNLEKEFEEAERKAPPKETIGDIVWGLLNGRKHMAASNNDWQATSSITLAQARLRYELGKDYFPLLQASMKEGLKAELARGFVNYVQIVTSRDDRTCDKCKRQDGLKMSIQEALEKMPLPVKCDSEEGWCRCTYVYG
jgi:hypothetical protein